MDRRISRQAAILCLAAATLWPVLVAGRPMLFWDTVDYLETGSKLAFGTLRPPFYGYLIRLLHWNLSLWPVVFGQAALATWVIWRTMDAVRTPASLRILAAAVIAASSLPFFVIWIMADVLTGLAVLGAFILVARPPMPGWERGALAAFVFLAAAAHVTHLPLVFGVGLLLFGAALRWPALELSWRAALGVAAAPVVAAGMLLAANYTMYGVVRLTYSSPVLALTRQVEDGLTQRTLDAECGTRHWRLCEERAAIEGVSSLWFGFDSESPLQARLGGMVGYAAEAAEIVAATTRRFWLDSLTTGLERAGAILVSPDAASFGARRDHAKILEFFREHGFGFIEGRGRPGLDGGIITAAALADLTSMAWAPLLLIGGVIAWRRRAPLAAVLLGVCGAAIIANACIIGVGGDVEGRYHGRIVWLAVFACYLAATSGMVRSVRLNPTRSRGLADYLGIGSGTVKP